MRRILRGCAVGAAMLGAAASCRQILGLSELSPDAAPRDGAPPDQGPICLGSGAFSACFAAPPAGDVTLSGTLDTDTDSRCAPVQPAGWSPPSCFIYAHDLTVGMTIAAGSRPLVLAATGMILVGEKLDVSSHGTSLQGPGSAAMCTTGAGPGSSAGGAGGSFATAGGLGGDVGSGSGGVPGAAQSKPAMLRAGCPGQPGSGNATGYGLPGHGGGAVALLAGTAIVASGQIDASGGGGGPGDSGVSGGAGGGGGGAGGMIVLIGPTLDLAGSKIYADGGGGGGAGSGLGSGQAGADSDGTSACCAGGALVISGGSGAHDTIGAGSGSSTASSTEGGGGGGGGGAGFVLIGGTVTAMGRVSPLPMTP